MERAKEIVVDASVVARWYVKEDWSHKALELRDDFRAGKLVLISPRLLLYQVANGLRYSPELSPEEISDAVDSLVGTQIGLTDFDIRQWRNAVKNALVFGISLYDSAYYTTAETYSLKLVTADKHFFRKMGGKNSIFLKNYHFRLL